MRDDRRISDGGRVEHGSFCLQKLTMSLLHERTGELGIPIEPRDLDALLTGQGGKRWKPLPGNRGLVLCGTGGSVRALVERGGIFSGGGRGPDENPAWTNISVRSGEWAVGAEFSGAESSVTIRARSGGGEFVLQDSPSRPALVQLRAGPPFSAAVTREAHFSGGTQWSPDAVTPAIRTYYAGGGVCWQARYDGGVGGGSGGRARFESFWPDGTPQTIEFGSSKTGIHRPVPDGPAYSEFYPDGSQALEIYSEKGVIPLDRRGEVMARLWFPGCSDPIAVRRADGRRPRKTTAVAFARWEKSGHGARMTETQDSMSPESSGDNASWWFFARHTEAEARWANEAGIAKSPHSQFCLLVGREPERGAAGRSPSGPMTGRVRGKGGRPAGGPVR